jgi:hypothetical protein
MIGKQKRKETAFSKKSAKRIFTAKDGSHLDQSHLSGKYEYTKVRKRKR